MAENLLEIRNLKTFFETDLGTLKAVNGLSLSIPRKGVVALVGESGSGKSMTALSILRLVPEPAGKIVGGEIVYHRAGGKPVDLLTLSEEEMRKIRGDRIAMIFQEPMTSLNPVYTVGDQIGEAVKIHQKKSRRESREVAIGMLKKVGIPNPDKRVDDYPHQMSGGMRQRVMIAMALSCHPELLIADEPTTALDVTIQAQILELIHQLIDEMGMSLLLITHDLGIVAENADSVAVMYAGNIVEQASVKSIFAHPKHPYTKGLLESVPRLKGEKGEKLFSIPGTVPNLALLPRGCAFQDRCERVAADCRENFPQLLGEASHRARCFYPY